jgi:hypothetical protein
MREIYTIRREDYFKARGEGKLPADCVLSAGSIWILVTLTPEERSAYPYPIEKGA